MTGVSVLAALVRFARSVGLVVALAAAALVFAVARVGAAAQGPARLPAAPVVEAGDSANVAVTRDAVTPQVKTNKRSDARDPFAPGDVLALGAAGSLQVSMCARETALPSLFAEAGRCRSLIESLPESRAPPHCAT